MATWQNQLRDTNLLVPTPSIFCLSFDIIKAALLLSNWQPVNYCLAFTLELLSAWSLIVYLAFVCIYEYVYKNCAATKCTEDKYIFLDRYIYTTTIYSNSQLSQIYPTGITGCQKSIVNGLFSRSIFLLLQNGMLDRMCLWYINYIV